MSTGCSIFKVAQVDQKFTTTGMPFASARENGSPSMVLRANGGASRPSRALERSFGSRPKPAARGRPGYRDHGPCSQHAPVHAASCRLRVGQPAMMLPRSMTPPPAQSQMTRARYGLRLAIWPSGST